MATRDFRRCGAVVSAAVLIACATVIAVPQARAFKILQTDCGGDEYRDPGGWPVIEMCLNPPGFPGLTSATDPNANTFAAARGGMLSGHWMWVREGTSDASLFVDTGAGCGNGSGFSWFDNANEKNNVWWESTATVQSVSGCGTAIGCTSNDEALCIPLFNESTHIIAADIVVSNQPAYTVVNQDTLVDCFRPGMSHETLWLHEIGHAYGLDHDNATVAVMKSSVVEMRNCHVAQGFHNYPFPDDMAGLMKHHKGFSGTKRNLAGTPWFRGSDGVDKTDVRSPVNVSSTQTKDVFVTVSLEAFYATTTMTAQLWLVPVNETPTFNFSTKTWHFGSKGVKTGWFEQSGFTVTTQRVTLEAPVSGSWLWANTTYRVWVEVDASKATVETDEGDNVFPTSAMVVRI